MSFAPRLVLDTTLRIASLVNADPSAVRRARRARYMRTVYRERVQRLTCSLSREDFQQLKRHAEHTGLAPTAFLREAALAYMDQRYLVPADVVRRQEAMTAEIRRCGTLINQLAAKANTRKEATLSDIRAARALLVDLDRRLRDYFVNPSRIDDPQVPGPEDGELPATDDLSPQGGGTDAGV